MKLTRVCFEKDCSLGRINSYFRRRLEGLSWVPLWAVVWQRVGNTIFEEVTAVVEGDPPVWFWRNL